MPPQLPMPKNVNTRWIYLCKDQKDDFAKQLQYFCSILWKSIQTHVLWDMRGLGSKLEILIFIHFYTFTLSLIIELLEMNEKKCKWMKIYKVKVLSLLPLHWKKILPNNIPQVIMGGSTRTLKKYSAYSNYIYITIHTYIHTYFSSWWYCQAFDFAWSFMTIITP